MPNSTALSFDEPSNSTQDDTATVAATECAFTVTLAPYIHDDTFEWSIRIFESANVPAEYSAIVRSTVEEFVSNQWTASRLYATERLQNAIWAWSYSCLRVSECEGAWSGAMSSHPAATQEILARKREWDKAERDRWRAQDELTKAFESQLDQRNRDYVNNYLKAALASKDTDQTAVPPKFAVYFGSSIGA